MAEVMRYAEMKDSGVEWLGEIPNEWNLYPAGVLFQELKQKNNDKRYSTPFSFKYGEIVDKTVCSGDNEEIDEVLSAYRIVYPDTIMINGLNLNYDFISQRVAIVRKTGIITSAYLAVCPDKKKLYARYALFLLKAYDFRQVFHGIGSGVRKTLKYSDFKSVAIVSPSMSEQIAIAAYLDDKCAQIDDAIAGAKASIEEYKEWKASVIYEAVTKGLDASVEMKDSGVESLGEIPADWNLVRLKFLLEAIVDCPHETPNYNEDGPYFVIRTADQDVGFLRSDDKMYRLNEQEYLSRIRRMSLEKGDIVYGREGERWGLACLIPESNKYCLGQRMMHFRCDSSKILPEFALWALNSQGTYTQGIMDTLGSTSPHVNISTIKNFALAVPSLEKQREIVSFLTDKNEQIQKVIEEKEALIANLESYKKSLIYEVVTGKRKVV